MNFDQLYGAYNAHSSLSPDDRWVAFVDVCLDLIRPHATTTFAITIFSRTEQLWRGHAPEPQDLEDIRLEVWAYLKSKWGTWTVMEDREDIVLRCLVGVLWREKNLEQVATTAAFIADNL